MTPWKTLDHPDRTACDTPPIRVHEHAWLVQSAHRTSDGRVLYVRCSGCTARRVDHQGDGQLPPTAISVVVAARTADEGRASAAS